MKKTKYPKTARILIITGATFGVILLIWLFIIPSIFKNIIEQNLNKQLGVQTSIGSVSLSLLNGSATMRDVTINNPSGFISTPFLSLQKVFITTSLTSLFTHEIQIELVDIEHLVLKIQRTKEGYFNFKPIMEHLKSTTPPSSSPTSPKKPTEKPSEVQTTKGIFLALLKAKDVQISFEDYRVSELPLITELKNISISLKSFRYPDTPSKTESEIDIKGQLVATKTSPFITHSTFQLGTTPPVTLISDSQQNLENVYLPHFNPYAERYGYLFKSGLVSITYTGKTAKGLIDGLANIRFDTVQLEKTGFRLSAAILGIPVQALPQLFQDPKGTLQLDLEVRGEISNPQISWSKLSEQLLKKVLGNAFSAGSIAIRKPLDLIIKGITQGESTESLLQKLKDALNPQTPPEEKKEEPREGEQKEKPVDLFKKGIMEEFEKLKKLGE